MVIAAFVGGVFVGIAGDHFYLFHRRRPPFGQFVTRRIVEHLDRELNLTSQQKAAVEHIIDQHHTRIDALMSGIQPQVRAEIDAANAEIDKILTPQQRDQFNKMRMRIRGRRHGPPSPPF